MSKATAQLMIKNYQKKLGMLSIVQEAIKGFPQGIPEVAQSVMKGNPEMQGGEEEQEMGGEEMAYGGNIPKYQRFERKRTWSQGQGIYKRLAV